MQDSPSINPYLGPGGWAVSKRPSFLLSDLNRPSAKKSQKVSKKFKPSDEESEKTFFPFLQGYVLAKTLPQKEFVCFKNDLLLLFIATRQLSICKTYSFTNNNVRH